MDQLLTDIYDDDDDHKGKNNFSNFIISSSRDFPNFGIDTIPKIESSGRFTNQNFSFNEPLFKFDKIEEEPCGYIDTENTDALQISIPDGKNIQPKFLDKRKMDKFYASCNYDSVASSIGATQLNKHSKYLENSQFQKTLTKIEQNH